MFAVAGIAGSAWLLFGLLECTFSAEFSAIRRTVFDVFRRFSALFGAFRRSSAFFGAFRHMHAAKLIMPFLSARGACFGLWQGGRHHPSNGLDFGATCVTKASVVQTKLALRTRDDV